MLVFSRYNISTTVNALLLLYSVLSTLFSGGTSSLYSDLAPPNNPYTMHPSNIAVHSTTQCSTLFHIFGENTSIILIIFTDVMAIQSVVDVLFSFLKDTQKLFESLVLRLT